MAGKPEAAAEEKPVSADELKTGVKLTAGHGVVLLVGGVAPGPADPTGEGGSTDGPGSATGTGTSGGSGSGGEATAPADATGASPADGSGGATGTGGDAGTGGAAPGGDAGTGGEATGGAGTGTGTSGAATAPEPPPVPDTVRGAFDAAHFETNKAFPLKEALPTFRKVAAFANQNPDRTLVVVGHTDTVGDHASNLVLSRERAQSIQAYLHDDVDVWIDTFYKHPDPSKKWGTHEDQLMLMALPFDGSPFLAGLALGAALAAAVKKFQASASLDPSGAMDDATRRALVLAYMKAEGTSVPAGMQSDSLGASYDHLEVKTGLGVDSAKNRRVDVFFFKQPPAPPVDECRGHHDQNQLPCPVYDAWKKDAKDLGDVPPPPQEVALTIKGPAGGVAFLVLGADGVPVAVGGAVKADCPTLESSKTLLLLKDDGTATLKGLPKGKYTVVMAALPAGGDGGAGTDRARALARWGADRKREGDLSTGPATVDLTSA